MGKQEQDGGAELELDWKGRTPPENRSAQPASQNPGLEFALAPLLSARKLRVRQHFEQLEMLTGLETANSYDILDADGLLVLEAEERSGGMADVLLRTLFRPFRALTIDLSRSGTQLVLQLRRPFSVFLPALEVQTGDDRPLGRVQRRLHLWLRRYELLSPKGAVLGTIEGPLWRPFTFRVQRGATALGVIRKQWNGLLTEHLTDADSFELEFAPAAKDPVVRQLMLAAALLIDLSHFEGGRQGSALFLPRGRV